MFRPVEMCKINVLVLNKHLMDVARRLGDYGVVHLVDAASQSEGGLLNNLDAPAEQQSLRMAIERCEQLIRQLGVDEDAEVPRLDEMSRQDIDAMLGTISGKLSECNAKMSKLILDAGGVEQEKERLSDFPVKRISLDVLHSLSHFYMVAGRLAPSLLPSARAMINDRGIIVEVEGKDGNVLVMSSRKNRWVVEDELSKLGFVAVSVPEGVDRSIEDECKDLDDKLGTLLANLETSRLAVLKLGELYGSVLLSMRVQLHGMLAVQKTRRHFGQMAHLACISGWIPKTELEAVKKIVEENTSGTGIVIEISVEDDARVKAGIERVPTKMEGNALTRPFQMLVKNFGVPLYTEIDPTIFVGITFVLLFGFMFGDIGQGLVLALAGLWMKFTRKKLSESMRDTGMLLTLCGVSAMIFGLAYGSIFGNEHLFEALWVNPMKSSDITQLLLTAVGVGTVFTSVAIIINIINHFRAKKYFDGTFDRFGVLGLLFFWACLAIGVWIISGNVPADWMYVLLILPLILLFIKEPIHNVLHKHGMFHGGIFGIILEACIETMETLTGYISGTVSFIRVGAFAISHAALCFAVFSIAGMLKNVPGGPVIQFIIIVLGNVLVICFEGMVAMIQGVRLEYYELFSKFYEGGGVAYKPFSLNPENVSKEAGKSLSEE